jgi:hypothetical protein
VSPYEQYVADTGQDASDPLTRHCWEQLQREQRRGKHDIQCSGYNERQCDCGQVDGIEQRFMETLAEVMSTLSHSACSPPDQQIYDRARALLAAHGHAGPPEAMVSAMRVWEFKRS